MAYTTRYRGTLEELQKAAGNTPTGNYVTAPTTYSGALLSNAQPTPSSATPSSLGTGIVKRYDNVMVDGGSRPDYSKLISNAMLDGKDASYVQSLVDQRNSYIASDPSLAKYKDNDINRAALDYIARNKNSNDQYLAALQNIYAGQSSMYSQALEEQRRATDAAVEKAVGELNAQKIATGQSYADLFRQLYRNKVGTLKNIDQRLAAQGITGGAAESSVLDIESDYADALRQGDQERISTLADLDRAITDTRLEGDVAKANAAIASAEKRASGYAAVLRDLISRNDELARLEASKEASDSENSRSYAYKTAFALINSGAMPGDDLLGAAGISKADAESLVSQINAQKSVDNTPSAPSTTTPYTQTTPMTLELAREAAEAGVFDDAVLATLKANGYTDNMISQMYGYVKPTNKIDASSTLSPGMAAEFAKHASSDGGLPLDFVSSFLEANPQISYADLSTLLSNTGFRILDPKSLGLLAQNKLSQILYENGSQKGLTKKQIGDLEKLVTNGGITDDELNFIISYTGAI